MTKIVMSSCSTCLGTNLPLAATLCSVSLSSFSFVYLFCSVQMRVNRGRTRGNSQRKQTVPTSQSDKLASVGKRRLLLQPSWCTNAAPALLIAFMSEWVKQVWDVPVQSGWDECLSCQRCWLVHLRNYLFVDVNSALILTTATLGHMPVYSAGG